MYLGPAVSGSERECIVMREGGREREGAGKVDGYLVLMAMDGRMLCCCLINSIVLPMFYWCACVCVSLCVSVCVSC